MGHLRWMGLFVVACLLPACAARQPPAESPRAAAEPERPTDAIGRGGRVSLSSFALAGRVSWQAARTAGNAVRGLVTGGLGSARRNWDAGANRTREIAAREAQAVREANEP